MFSTFIGIIVLLALNEDFKLFLSIEEKEFSLAVTADTSFWREQMSGMRQTSILSY